MRYARGVTRLVCPFCGEKAARDDATMCAVCDVPLALPPSSPDVSSRARHDDDDDDELEEPPEHRPIDTFHFGHGRGPLLALAALGAVLFFLPWIDKTFPAEELLSGFDLARRLGWSWGAGVAWLVLIPTVASRRSVAQLRGARVAAAFLSAVPAVTCGILLVTPQRSTIVPVAYEFTWAFWLTLAASAVCLATSLRLGAGPVADRRAKRETSPLH